MKKIVLLLTIIITGCAVDMTKVQAECQQAEHLQPKYCTPNNGLAKRPDDNPNHQYFKELERQKNLSNLKDNQ